MPWMHTFRLLLRDCNRSHGRLRCLRVHGLCVDLAHADRGHVAITVDRSSHCISTVGPTMLAVLAVAWVSAITLLGFPLSVCAIVTERKADAFDGVSRSAGSNVFQRPLVFILLITAFQLLSFAASEIFGAILWVGKSLMVDGF